MQILLVEDDQDLADSLRHRLAGSFQVTTVANGQKALHELAIGDFQAIILDLSLPDITGQTLCQKMRADAHHQPIIALTGQNELGTKVTALELGFDDYLVKPVAPAELTARIRACLRRPYVQHPNHKLTVGCLSLDLESLTVVRDGQTISLRKREATLLAYLMHHAGRVVTRDMILSVIWSASYETDPNVVNVHIKVLRDRIDRNFNKKLIKTVHGLGYKLETI